MLMADKNVVNILYGNSRTVQLFQDAVTATGVR